LFWQKPMTTAEKLLYLELTERLGIKGFSDVITRLCVQFLGLEESLVSWMDLSKEYPAAEYLRDILDAEEFGKSDRKRMVVMRGTGFFDYVREFHHQMRLNYSRAGRCFLFWPVLWIMTLVCFVRNNQKLRNTSTTSILREAARRSRMMRKIKLFR